MHTRQEIETALSTGRLWMKMSNGREWVCRRNGATKLWKTRPNDWEVPVKAGMRECARIDPTNAHYFTIHD